jgi:hypothetical protein
LIDDSVATTGAAIPAKGLAAAGTDGTNARIIKTDTGGIVQTLDTNSAAIKTAVELIDDTVGATGAAIPAKGVVAIGTDGANARAIRTDATGIVQTLDTNSGAIKTAVELLDDAVGATGAAIPAKGVTAIGTDGTNARALKTDTAGLLTIDVTKFGGAAVVAAAAP